MRLRAFARSGVTINAARAVFDRYGRALNDCRADVGGHSFTEFLRSDAAGDPDEDLDERFIELAKTEIDAAIHAAGALRQAMLRKP